MTNTRTPTTPPGLRCALRHYGEMILAMLLGMVVLGGAAAVLPVPEPGPEIAGLVMATAMAVPMALWMRRRGHGRRAVTEMSAVMYLSFVVLYPLLWSGVLDADGVMLGAHVLMLPAMAAAMVVRPREYGLR